MKKINFKALPDRSTPVGPINLNTMQNNIEESAVIVSATEPTTNEKVWFQKSKNLFDKKLIKDGIFLKIQKIYYKLKPNTKYTVSTNVPNNYNNAGGSAHIFIRSGYYEGESWASLSEGAWNNNPRTVTSDSQGNITIGYRKASNIPTLQDFWYQLEEGTQATPYEPITPNKILTKSNGVFEEFNTSEVITNENGTAIKYANGIMKIYRKIENIKIDITTAWGNLFVGKNDTVWNFPLPFISEPFDYSIRIETKFNASTFPVNYVPTELTNKSIKNVSIGRPTSKAGNTGTIYITATGFWK